MAKLYTVAIIGCGGRGSDSYGYLINLDKEHFKIVSLCDIRQEWLERAGRNFDVPTENQFLTEEEFFQEKRADILLVTVASGVGGVMDLTMQKELQRDAKDYAKDNFKMNLQNIHALPNTLNKVSSLVATSKLFPFIEFYTCTDTEREAFRKKLKYNGYTIERIGFIKDFLNPSDTTFIKAKLIRNETITCDADELLEISNELNKGVFIE